MKWIQIDDLLAKFDERNNFNTSIEIFIKGGYRAGLTIAHGSQVAVQCEGTEGTEQMSIYRFA